MSDRLIVVTHRAASAYIDRLNDGLSPAAVFRLIEDEVRLAIAEGRVQNHKINGFGLFGEKRRQLPANQRFVWPADERCGWIIAREAAEDVVVTTLSRAGARSMA